MTKPKASKPKIDYFDERRGYWTTFEIGDQWLVFRKGDPKSRWFATLMVALIAITLVLGMLQSALGWLTLLFLIYLVVTTRRGTRIGDRKNFPIVITTDVESARSEFQHGQYFKRRDVRKFIVRENKNRDGSDTRLIQIYMQLKNSDYLVLLYQNYWTKKAENQAEEIAQRFRDWRARSDK